MTVIFHLDEESSLLIVVSAATSRPAGTTDQTQQTLPGHHPQAAPGQRVALCPLWWWRADVPSVPGLQLHLCPVAAPKSWSWDSTYHVLTRSRSDDWKGAQEGAQERNWVWMKNSHLCLGEKSDIPWSRRRGHKPTSAQSLPTWKAQSTSLEGLVYLSHGSLMRQCLGSKKSWSVFTELQNHPEMLRQCFLKWGLFSLLSRDSSLWLSLKKKKIHDGNC